MKSFSSIVSFFAPIASPVSAAGVYAGAGSAAVHSHGSHYEWVCEGGVGAVVAGVVEPVKIDMGYPELVAYVDSKTGDGIVRFDRLCRILAKGKDSVEFLFLRAALVQDESAYKSAFRALCWITSSEVATSATKAVYDTLIGQDVDSCFESHAYLCFGLMSALGGMTSVKMALFLHFGFIGRSDSDIKRILAALTVSLNPFGGLSATTMERFRRIHLTNLGMLHGDLISDSRVWATGAPSEGQWAKMLSVVDPAGPTRPSRRTIYE